MANRLNRQNQDWEAKGAAISLAGVRPISDMTSQSVSGTSAYAYTVASEACRRVLVLVIGGSNGDIRINLNKTADGSDWPVLVDSYYSVSVQKDDTVDVYNTTSGAITVYFLEVY